MTSKGKTVSRNLSFLADSPLFARLSEDALTSLAQDCSFQQVEKGDVLFLQSDPSDSAYIVCSGRIAIVLQSSDGRELAINEMSHGDLFGELGILTRKNRSTSAIAQMKGEVLVIPSRAFRRIIENEPQLTVRLLEVTAGRLQQSGERESALAFMDAQARLARLLLELEKQEQEKGYVTISQEELAQRTGLIRQTVAKALGKWRRAGWLITGRGRILILNKKALRALEKQMVI
jgi:CRP/FNR family cyclic AMP-dependent transcriptional regulator